MAMIQALNISAAGIQDAVFQVESAANNIASQASTECKSCQEQDNKSPSPPKDESLPRESVFGADMVSEAVTMKLGQIAAQANAQALRATNNAIGTILDMVDTKDN